MSDFELKGRITIVDEATSTLKAVSDSVTQTGNAAAQVAEQQKKTVTSTGELVKGFNQLGVSAFAVYQGFDSIERAGVAADRANLNLMRSAESVEKAQSALNDAVAKYGADSEQAKNAADALAIAQEANSVSTDRAKLAQDNISETMGRFALSVIPTVFSGIDGLTRVYDNWGSTAKLGADIAEAAGGAMEFLRSGTVLETTAKIASTAAQWAWNVAMDANPIGIVIIALAGLAAAVLWAYNNVKPFHDAVDALGRKMSEILGPIIERINAGLKALGDWWDSITGKAKEASAAVNENAVANQMAAVQAGFNAERQKTLDAAYAGLKPEIDAVTRAQEAMADAQTAAQTAAQNLTNAQQDLASTVAYVTGKTADLSLTTDDVTWASGSAESAFNSLDAQLKVLNGTIDADTAATRALQDQLDGNRLSSDKLRLQQMLLKDSFDAGKISAEEYKNKNAELEAQQRKLQESSLGLTIQGEELKSKLDEEKTAAEGVTGKMDLLKTANDNAKDAAKDNKTAQENLTAAQNKLSEAITGLKTALDAIVTKLGLTQTELDKFKTKTDAATNANAGLSTQLDWTTTDLSGYVDAINRIPSSKTTTITTIYKAISSTAAGVPQPSAGYVTPGGGASPVGGYIPSQHGFEGIVSQPTTFLAGEAGPEAVSVRPMGGGGGRGGKGGGDTYNMTFNASFPDVDPLYMSPMEVQRKFEPLIRYLLKNMQARR